MIRTIWQRLLQLLCSLLGRGGSDEGDQAEQNTEQDTTQSDAKSRRDDGAEHDDRPDDIKDDSGDDQGDDQGDDGNDGDDDQDGNGGGAGGAEADVDAEADAEADVDVNAEADGGAEHGDQDGSEDVSINHSSNEEIGLSWPPRDPVAWPNRPDEPGGTIEVRLFHTDSELGLQACRQTAPFLEWALLDAWAERFNLDVDVSIRTEPVPDEHATPEDFDNWIWTDDCEMAKDANILVAESATGAAGGYSGHVSGPDHFEGWGFNPDNTDDEGRPKVVPYGGGESRRGTNLIIHETLHCLGLSHNGRFDEFSLVSWYGQDYLPPLWTSYREHTRFTAQLCEANRRVRPSVQ